MRPETREAGVGNSKEASEPSLSDKGKGKEVVDEETLQEE